MYNPLDLISFTTLYGAGLIDLPEEGSDEATKEAVESGLKTLAIVNATDENVKLAVRNAVAIGYLTGLVKAEGGQSAPPAAMVVIALRTASLGGDLSGAAGAFAEW